MIKNMLNNRTLHNIYFILRCHWCDKLKSIYYSLKYNCRFVVGPNSIIRISKNSRIHIEECLYFNRPWGKKQNGSASLSIGENASLDVRSTFASFSGCDITVSKGASLSLGHSYINVRSHICCFNSISIGDGCAIGENVAIRDSDNHFIERDGYEMSRPITIGNNVWIGMHSIILKGVVISDGSVIGAGSVVNKHVKGNSLYAGVPAKYIKEISWH